MNIDKIELGGITLTGFNSIEQAGEIISGELFGKASYAVAINPEKIITAIDDDVLRNILSLSTLNYMDGIGVVKATNEKYSKNFSRIPGCDLWEELMKRAAEKNTPVYIIGASEAVSINVAEKLVSSLGVNLVGRQNGYFDDEKLVIDMIKQSGAQFVSIAMGSPRQEKLIQKCLNSGVQAFFMGVGGTYDVFTGEVIRAPKFFQALNLEWAFRLLLQPQRIFRQSKLIRFYTLWKTGKL
ncbi:WecB/TagA/CpsF family glycosyltransferase [Aeromonas caviae]|uniref:WecB/TagA/CpsF family glycosyltransferase n=1 Tax=Aeromonas TaxID=642 RepID=UPI0022E7C242|nr:MULTISPECIES: WecB/TagA/CpsF family glycosyltransferase [Aeromonas]MEB5775836.1 WecB/TagA/CpsF family glycosyltransferase [Aeromonas caviae]MEB6651062.1 WecB/TagA/CpsF family glycosyltransferase [Aeromonas caviae]